MVLTGSKQKSIDIVVLQTTNEDNLKFHRTQSMLILEVHSAHCDMAILEMITLHEEHCTNHRHSESTFRMTANDRQVTCFLCPAKGQLWSVLLACGS